LSSPALSQCKDADQNLTSAGNQASARSRRTAAWLHLSGHSRREDGARGNNCPAANGQGLDATTARSNQPKRGDDRGGCSQAPYNPTGGQQSRFRLPPGHNVVTLEEHSKNQDNISNAKTIVPALTLRIVTRVSVTGLCLRRESKASKTQRSKTQSSTQAARRGSLRRHRSEHW
jgi:hypothetical protein